MTEREVPTQELEPQLSVPRAAASLATVGRPPGIAALQLCQMLHAVN